MTTSDEYPEADHVFDGGGDGLRLWLDSVDTSEHAASSSGREFSKSAAASRPLSQSFPHGAAWWDMSICKAMRSNKANGDIGFGADRMIKRNKRNLNQTKRRPRSSSGAFVLAAPPNLKPPSTRGISRGLRARPSTSTEKENCQARSNSSSEHCLPMSLIVSHCDVAASQFLLTNWKGP